MDIVELRVKGGLQLNKWLLINTVNWNTIFFSFKAYRLYISCTLPKKQIRILFNFFWYTFVF
jgi:hypothetical protein